MEPIGDAVRQELNRFGSTGAMAGVVGAWPGLVGEQVAANAWPARIARDGTLIVNANSSTWAFELGQLEGEILPRLQAALGKAAPKRLRFVPGPLPEPAVGASVAASRLLLEATPSQAREAHSWAAAIDSEELRKTVEKAARASLARADSGRSI